MHIPSQMAEFVSYFKQGVDSPNSPLELADFARFGLQGEVRHFKKGEQLISQGEPARNIFFLIHGLARYFSVSVDGKEFTQSFAGAPGIAGSTRAMAFNRPALFSIEAMDEVLCLQFNWQDFFSTMEAQPGFLKAYNRLLEHMFAKKEEREYFLLQKNAEQRYLEFLDEHPQLRDKISLKIVASYIGITPIALSRIRKKLFQ